MRFLVLPLLLAASCVVHAAPAATEQADAIDRIVAEKSLGEQINQVRQSVTVRASELVIRAMAFLDVPYRRGGTSAESGFDCSGFVRTMYNQTLGYLLPRRAVEQASATEKIDRDDLQPGDLVFFNTMRRAFSHVGIYVGDGKFIHAPRTGAQIRVESLNANYWQHRFTGARRVLLQDGVASANNIH